MKLAFCLFNYFPYGGLQRDFMRLARFCHRQGHEIHVYTMKWEGEKEPLFHLHLIHTRGLQNHTRIRNFCQRIKSELTDGRYDAVIGFNKMPNLHIYYAADVCYQARVLEEKNIFYRLLPRYKQYALLEKKVFEQGKPTEVLLLSDFEAAKYQQYYQTESERLHILPPCIKAHGFTDRECALYRQQIREDYHVKKNQQIMLMVGSGFKTKGVDRAIKALASLPAHEKAQTLLWIIGRDDPRSYIKLATKLHVADHVRFLGARSDVPKFLQAADLLLHPSYHENTGTVILEAIDAGLPVLTLSSCGYAKYVLSANAGKVLATPYQPASFHAALLEMLNADKTFWKQNAKQYIKDADIYDNNQNFLNLVQKIAQDPQPVSVKTKFYLHPKIRQTCKEPYYFNYLMQLKGERYRNQDQRITQHVHIEHESYFIKQHYGIGWREILKNLLQGKLPILSAKNEWLAINHLQKLGVAVPQTLGYGIRGINPARLQSFILLSALDNKISLEELGERWKTKPPSLKFKRTLITKIAQIARVLHDNGINHRDFYLCHFLLDYTSIETKNPALYLIDLHRAQIRKTIPLRWRVKDLAGLYFSSLDVGLTKHDLYCFMKAYHQSSLRDSAHQKIFWKKVILRGNELYRKHQG